METQNIISYIEGKAIYHHCPEKGWNRNFKSSAYILFVKVPIILSGSFHHAEQFILA